MGILLVYDVTDDKSFANMGNWIRNIEQHASENVNKILIGNKCDLVDKKVSHSHFYPLISPSAVICSLIFLHFLSGYRHRTR